MPMDNASATRATAPINKTRRGRSCSGDGGHDGKGRNDAVQPAEHQRLDVVAGAGAGVVVAAHGVAVLPTRRVGVRVLRFPRAGVPAAGVAVEAGASTAHRCCATAPLAPRAALRRAVGSLG